MMKERVIFIETENYSICKCKIIVYVNVIVKNIMNVNRPSSILSLIMTFIVQWEMKSDVETAV